MKKGFYSVFVLSMLLLLIGGCATNNMYRDNYENCEVTANQTCHKNALQTHRKNSESEYLLSFVEIDDQGQIRDRQQLKSVLDELYLSAGKNSLLINVFVHGWHHNAKPGDTNITDFRSSLKMLSATESQLSAQQNREARKVVGVYIGWRGESITTPWVNNITFWDRKNTAQEVGYLGVSEVLLKLEEIANVKNATAPTEKSRLVIIGHSFGGAVVYSATSQILASRFINSRGDKSFISTADGFGDLVVLLNPAFEALRFAPLFDLAQARCSYMPSQKPKLAILTSVADDATATLFPLGRFFSTLFETHTDLERNECGFPLAFAEGSADRKTVGHFDPLITHTLKPVDETDTVSSKATVRGKVSQLWKKQKSGVSLQVGPTVLTHLGKTNPLNPYLNIRVDKRLIKDHNDIFGKEIQEFLREFILLSTGHEG